MRRGTAKSETDRTRRVGRMAALSCALIAVAALTACGPQPADGPGGDAAPPTAAATPTADPAPQLADLLTADVPELCEHEAGALEDGRLPGIPKQEGRVTLGGTLIEDLEAGATESDFGLAGTDSEGEPYLAAVVSCDQGGVSWPDQVLVWDADLTVTGAFAPSDLTGGDREHIMGIASADGGISVHWNATNQYDAACCGQLSAETTVEVSGGELTAAKPTLHRGEEQVRAVAEAAMEGTTADDVEVADGLYDNLAVAIEKTDGLEPDGVKCSDQEVNDYSGSLICGIPAKIDGQQVSFIIYPTFTAWNEYELAGYEMELW